MVSRRERGDDVRPGHAAHCDCAERKESDMKQKTMTAILFALGVFAAFAFLLLALPVVLL